MFFLVQLFLLDADHASHLAERLRERVEREGLALSGTESVPFTVSLGVADYHPAKDGSIDSSEKLLQAADAALYRAKTGGRNRVVVA